MAVQPYAWQGITTTYINSTGVSSTVGRIKKVPAPTYTAEDIDVSDQDSGGVKQFIAGMKEGSEVELVMNDIPSDAGQIALIADEGNVGTILHVFPSGRSIQYPITIKTVNVIDDGKAGALSVKGKVSGTITRGTTLQQLSALTVSAGTLFPAFAVGTYEYQLPELNAASTITVTPTSASASITVDGTAVTSGAASGNITLTAGAITNIEIIVQRTGYTTTVYKIKAARAST